MKTNKIDEIKLLKRQLKQSQKYNAETLESFGREITTLQAEKVNLKDDLTKFKEVLKREEEGFLHRISNLEHSLTDSFEDNERLQIVINALGKTIKQLEQKVRSDKKKLNNYQTSQMQAYNTMKFTGADFIQDPNVKTNEIYPSK